MQHHMKPLQIAKLWLAALVVALCLGMAVETLAQAGPAPAAAAQSAKNQEAAFQFKAMLARGWPIISVLMIMSIISLSIMAERMIVVKGAERDADSFLPDMITAIKGGKPLDALLGMCDAAGHPLASVVSTVLGETGDRENMDRAAQRALQLKVDKLERRTPMLGTIASTAPFVGLLGTVVGIIKAFHDLSIENSGAAKAVMAGISEALVATAVGLFVAIPAVLAYNAFQRRIRARLAAADGLMHILLSDLKGVPSPKAPAAKSAAPGRAPAAEVSQ